MGMWTDVMDEYGEKRGMEVLGEMAQKWFRRPFLEPEDERFNVTVVAQDYILNASHVSDDMMAGLTQIELGNISAAVAVWYGLTMLLDLEGVDETDHAFTGREGKLLEFIQTSITTLGVKAVYKDLTAGVEGVWHDTSQMMQDLLTLAAPNLNNWTEDQAYLARAILERVNAVLVSVQGMARLGLGENVFLALELERAAADVKTIAMENMSILAPRAQGYVSAVTRGLDVTTEPEKWLYVGADIFDLWFAAARERDKWIRTLAVQGSPDTELFEAAKVYVAAVCAED